MSSATTAEVGRRTTGPRRAIAALVAGRSGYFTAADLIADARAREVSVGRATIFRTLDVLAEQGALERIDLPSGDHAYVGCEPEQHHHHVVCRDCGESVEVDDLGLQAVVRAIGERSGYRIESHRLELFGLCPACRRTRR